MKDKDLLLEGLYRGIHSIYIETLRDLMRINWEQTLQG